MAAAMVYRPGLRLQRTCVDGGTIVLVLFLKHLVATQLVGGLMPTSGVCWGCYDIC